MYKSADDDGPDVFDESQACSSCAQHICYYEGPLTTVLEKVTSKESAERLATLREQIDLGVVEACFLFIPAKLGLDGVRGLVLADSGPAHLQSS